MHDDKNNQVNKIKPLLYLLAFCVLTGISLLVEFRRENNSWTEVSRGTQGASTDVLPETSSANDLVSKTEVNSVYFPIYLVGAVKNPGIYRIGPETCLFEVIEEAGGLTEDAAAERINLAMLVQAYQHIYIPTRAEVLENPSLLDSIQNDDSYNPLIDINRADQTTLEKLPGIGPVTAKAIIDYRTKNGSFSRIEDLMLVPGIKESRFSSLQDLIMVSGGP